MCQKDLDRWHLGWKIVKKNYYFLRPLGASPPISQNKKQHKCFLSSSTFKSEFSLADQTVVRRQSCRDGKQWRCCV